MLDYDMLSSPNYARLVYDGDGSEGDNPAGPEGSGTVEEVYREWFASKRQAVVGIPFDGRSDYVGFTDRGIPAGGVFAGAEGVKTANEERVFGGDAGSWYDPCYHQACDDITTVLSGVPPLDAEGLAVDIEDATDADKAVAAQKMRGGSRKSMIELGAGATYATWYFSSVKNPFGTGAATASIARTSATKRAKQRGRRAAFDHRGHEKVILKPARAPPPLRRRRPLGLTPTGRPRVPRARRRAGRDAAARGRRRRGGADRPLRP